MIRRRVPASLAVLCVGFALLLCLALEAGAQPPASAAADASGSVPHKSRRKRAKVSKRAEFAGAGLLQFEYGYDGNFRQPEADKDQTAAASVLFNPAEWLQFECDFETLHALTMTPGQTATGIGDTYTSAQFTALSEAPRHPSVAVSYLVKLPSGNAGQELGTGRVDHKLGLLASKKVVAVDVDFNASLLINGNPTAHGWETGYQLALGFSREITSHLSLQGDLFGETLDTDQPRGLFVQGGVTYHPTANTSFDVGIRAGLTSEAPRFGVVAGVSLNLANLYGAGRPRTKS